MSMSGPEPVYTIGLCVGTLITVQLLGQTQYLLTIFKLSSPTINALKASASQLISPAVTIAAFFTRPLGRTQHFFKTFSLMCPINC